MNKETIQINEKAIKAEQNKKKIENSGIVSVFKGLIENGSVSIDRSENKKAEIAWFKAGKEDKEEDNSSVLLVFDREYVTSHGGNDTYYKALVAKIEKDGNVYVSLSRAVVNGYSDNNGDFEHCYFSENQKAYYYNGSRNDIKNETPISLGNHEQTINKLLNR